MQESPMHVVSCSLSLQLNVGSLKSTNGIIVIIAIRILNALLQPENLGFNCDSMKKKTPGLNTYL